ncbi:hypothetical protein CNMCM8686_005261 [Aspergillus fumigatus]|nr:hypothetical protein CNMCM8686_005261 [Aspergillus fumigatus]
MVSLYSTTAIYDKPAKKADDDEVVDKTPILNEDGTTLDIEGGAFGPFDEEEDQERIARAERNRLRRKGLDPRAVLNKPKKSASKKTDASKKQEESKKEESAVENGDEKAAKTSDKVDEKADKKDKKADKSKTDSDSKGSKKNKKAASSSPGKKAGK